MQDLGWYFIPPTVMFMQGTWSLEGDKLVGSFKRVDNGNELKAVREIVGGELVQVGCETVTDTSQSPRTACQ